MIRKLALAVSIALGTLPYTVHGLGLGDLKTESALNEEFSGQIELFSVPKGELDGILVELAAPAAFAKAGVERFFGLSSLRFETLRLPNGKAVIKVTSTTPVNEPFLDFLIEVNWSKGRIIKEYTVLLDPPATTKRRPGRIEKARIDTLPSAVPVAETRKTSVSSRAAGSEYGPVAANETLWTIATELKPQNVSIHQMMMALQRANPDAFIRGNINLLKKGAVLRIPAADDVGTIAQREAVSSFKKQTDNWMETSPAEAPARRVEQVAAEPRMDAVEDDSQLRIAPAVAKAEKEEEAAATSAEQAEEVGEELAKELMMARENVETARQESDNLKMQMSSLEEQVDNMERLLALKDEQLAKLQAEISAQDTAVEPPPAEATVAVEPAVEEALTSADQEMAATQPMAPEAAVPADVEPEEAISATETAQPPVTDPMVPKQSSWLEDNTPVFLKAAGGLVGVGVLIALISGVRKRKERLAGPVATVAAEDESILLEEAPLGVSQPAESGKSVSSEADTSFLSEYSTEDLKALAEDTAEVDPVSEADVYIAYGRYQQAQDILQSALNNESADHTAVRYKLLEIHYATQNRDQFNTLAREMVASGQVDEDSNDWKQVRTMGRDLDKTNPLYAEGVSAADAISQLSSVDEARTAPPAEDSELSLDLSKLAEELDSSLGEESESLDSLESLDLGGSAFNIEAESNLQGAEKTDETATELAELEIGEIAAETELQTEMVDFSELADLHGKQDLEDELADISAELEDVMADSEILDQPLDIEEDASSLLANLDKEAAAVEEQTVEEVGTDLPSLEEEEVESILGEESETKLELAEAYMEMGDREGAISILQEVEEDGTEDQKERASRMLSDLNY